MKPIQNVLVILTLLVQCGVTLAHGLIEDPPSRNWYCGAITKPDKVVNGVAEYPVCGEAFDTGEFTAGYSFMSVLSHDLGRTAVTPLPEHVCSFGSETFQGNATPWDAAIDWPTVGMSPGRQEIKWNIQWGPHYSDTEEFRYWITRADFQFDADKPLTWEDFEETEFCVLGYDDSHPYDNPDVIPVKESAQFRTFCSIPERNGHHVIYGEWGRNHYTYERFHSCIDAEFDGNSVPQGPMTAIISEPNIESYSGEGMLTLDGSESIGENLSYQWSVSSLDNSYYTITEPSQATTTLVLTAPDSAQDVTVALMVSDDENNSSTINKFLHETQVLSLWVDLGLLTDTQQTLAIGDAVSIRTISTNGEDAFYPAPSVVLDAANAAADIWPVTLANAIDNISGATIAIGLLDNNDQVMLANNPSANRIYRLADVDVVSAFLQIDYAEEPNPGTSDTCNVTIRNGANPWWAGLDVATNKESVTLDFSATGLDLTNNLRIDAGNFSVNVNQQRVILTKPTWVTIDQPGYLGFNANNNPTLASFTVPRCITQ